MKFRKINELIELLGKYGEAKFGDEWWPGHAVPHLGKKHGKRLEKLLDDFDAELARRAQRRPAEPSTEPATAN